MIQKLVDQADAFLLFKEDSVIFVLRNGEETSIKQIDFPSLIATIKQTDFESDWYLSSKLRLLKIYQQEGEILTLSSIPPDTYLLKFKDYHLQVPLPGAIIIHHQGRLWIYAYQGELKFDSCLYHFPLPNINSTGQVCWGSAEMKTASPEKIWQSFINSEFNQDYDDGKSKAYPHNIVSQLQVISQSLNTIYPEQDLVSARLTLATLPQLKS
jgi:hypothetical protein